MTTEMQVQFAVGAIIVFYSVAACVVSFILSFPKQTKGCRAMQLKASKGKKRPFFDKSKKYDICVDKNGILYYYVLPKWKRPLYWLTSRIQWICWKIGLPYHCPLADECTPDGNCCETK